MVRVGNGSLALGAAMASGSGRGAGIGIGSGGMLAMYEAGSLAGLTRYGFITGLGNAPGVAPDCVTHEAGTAA